MSPRLTKTTKRATERAEEPVEPVKATTTPPADTAATDKLLDAIEEVLEDPPEEPKIKTKFVGFAALEDDIAISFLVPPPVFTPEPPRRNEEAQRLLYEMFVAESFEPDPLVLEEIRAQGDRYARVRSRDCGCPSCRPERQEHGDSGLCGRCGWPSAGPPGPACQRARRFLAPPSIDPCSITQITEY